MTAKVFAILNDPVIIYGINEVQVDFISCHKLLWIKLIRIILLKNPGKQLIC